MKPREWVGCVVGVRCPYDVQAATIRRAWVGARSRRLRRVELVWGAGIERETPRRWTVASVERLPAGDLAGLRVLTLGVPW